MVRREIGRAFCGASLVCALAGVGMPGAGVASAEGAVPKGAVDKLGAAPCPAPYSVRIARQVDPAEATAARRGIFQIAGQRVEITRQMNWRYDPLGSASFRARLHDLRWLDTLLFSYRVNGDRAALRRAKRIVVDWVKQNPLAAPSTDRTWFDKVVGDRAPYLAYVTRAAPCAGMLPGEPLARKLKVKEGDSVLIRLERPSAISRDAPLSGSTNEDIALRRTVAAGLEAFFSILTGLIQLSSMLLGGFFLLGPGSECARNCSVLWESRACS